MKKITKITFLMLLLIVTLGTKVTASEMPQVMKIAEKELNRSMELLSKEPLPPYFIQYTINDSKLYNLTASWGKMLKADILENRLFDIDLRVGNYNFDNTHIIRGGGGDMFGFRTMNDLPTNDEEASIRSRFWIATDRTYKSAIERFEKAKSNKAVKVEEEDQSDDFTKEKPEIYFETVKELNLDTTYWNTRLRKLSSHFNNQDKIFNAKVSLSASLNHKMIITSEGAKISVFEKGVRLMISAKTKAEDGMSLPLFQDWFSYDENKLPSDEELIKAIEEMKVLLIQLRNAPLAKTYSGPCILSGAASGVFFHEIFGHRVEGQRQKDPNSAQTFKQSIGKTILPDFIDVIFDPSLKQIAGQDLHGYYKYDDQGVKGQKVLTVENGKFKGFLMSRSPIDNFSKSNGHGRKATGNKPYSRQSNLVVEAKKTISSIALKDSLRAIAKRQGEEYGLYFEQVSGGFTFTGRQIPNSFNVTPLVVYKIYVDGRDDELVRGVDLIGTPLSTFANIVLADDKMEVFNGICGAESGPVPVSASSPSLLVSKIEVQKKQKSQAKLPILPPPHIKTNN